MMLLLAQALFLALGVPTGMFDGNG